MHNHVAKIHDEPAFASLSLDATSFLIVLFRGFQNGFGKRVEHTVTGPAADDEVVGKGRYIFDIEEQDVFTLFVLQGFDDFMGKF